MQAGVMVVVARITNAEFLMLEEAAGLPRASLLGQQVEARSVIELQRRNTTVVFKQMLYHADRLVAKAEIACVCIR
jgi:acyl-CoA thioesterase FadM